MADLTRDELETVLEKWIALRGEAIRALGEDSVDARAGHRVDMAMRSDEVVQMLKRAQDDHPHDGDRLIESLSSSHKRREQYRP